MADKKCGCKAPPKVPEKVVKETQQADHRMKNHENRGYFKLAKTKGGL